MSRMHPLDRYMDEAWANLINGFEAEVRNKSARIVELEGLWKEALLRLGEVAEENRILMRKVEILEDRSEEVD